MKTASRSTNRKAVASKRSTNGIQVIARAASVLRALKNERNGLSLAQIANRVGLARSTVQRIVNALVTEGLLLPANPDGGFRLGPEVQLLANSGRYDIAEILRPILSALAAETQETVDLAVLTGDRLIFIDQIPGVQRLRAVSGVGESFPLTVTANGKACLALLDPAEARRLATNELAAAKRGKESREISRLMSELEEVRRTGVAFDIDEHTGGISAVSVAFSDRNSTLYAVSVPAPSHRFKQERDKLVAAVLRARDQVTMRVLALERS